MFAKVLIMVIFLSVTCFIGIYCRKEAGNVGNFVLGGRRIGPWLTAFSYGTSYFSAVVFVGYAGQFGWNYGISATWIGLGNAFIGSFLAWAVLGRRTRIMTKHYDSATMPDFFAKRYASPAMRTITSVVIFVFLIPYSASVYKGLSELFSVTFNLDFSYCVIGMALLTALYVVLGGYMATAINDLVQGIIMLVGIAAVVYAVISGKGGLMSAIAELSKEISPLAPEISGSLVSFFGPDPLNLLSVVVLTSLGTWGLPQMVHKFYTIKNEDSIKAGTVISTVFALIVACGSYFMGGFGRLYYTPGPDGKVIFDSIVPAMLSSCLPDVLMGLVIILVLSASMSTLSSLVLTSSSTLTLDFINEYKRKNKLSEKQKLIIMRILVAVFIIISAVIAIVQYSGGVSFIAQMMGISWGALAGAFLAPFLFGLYWKRTTKIACYVNFAFSTVVMILNIFIRSSFPAILQSPINAGAFCMLAGFIIVPVISIITRAPEKETVSHIFSCYERRVSVLVTDSIGKGEEE